MTKNKIELTPYIGVDFRGDIITFDQWNVRLNERTVGYLGHAPGSRIMPVVNLPDATWDEVVTKLEEIRKPPGKVLPPFPIYVPPKELLEHQDEEEVEE
jgi:hypothetical protein